MTSPPPTTLRRVAAGVLTFTTLATATGCTLFSGTDGDWQEEAAAIEGIVDYRTERPDLVVPDHVDGQVFYEVRPPIGGQHFDTWYDCNGVVYREPLVDEHAVHSLEHGAVWLTYQPELPADQVASLADRVSGNDKLFLSPYPGLDAPISVQAWGYQLKLTDPGDDRIDEFIRVLRVNPAPEPDAPCTGGISASG